MTKKIMRVWVRIPEIKKLIPSPSLAIIIKYNSSSGSEKLGHVPRREAVGVHDHRGRPPPRQRRLRRRPRRQPRRLQGQGVLGEVARLHCQAHGPRSRYDLEPSKRCLKSYEVRKNPIFTAIVLLNPKAASYNAY